MTAREKDRTDTPAYLPAVLGTVALVVAVCGLHVLLEHRFFYWDDVQHTFAPVFYTIGDRLREGDWPTTTLLLWQGGFLAGEGLYQVFNPISLAIFALLPSIEDIALGMALHSTVWLAIAGSGACCLALRLGASRTWGVLAGLSYATSPFLLYWLAASWVNGVVGFGALPWAMHCLASREPRRADVAGLVLATYLVGVSGWIHAIIPLALFGAARVLLPDHALAMRARVALACALAAGAMLASPQLLATVAAVQGSMRASGLSNSGTAVASLQGLITAFWPAYVYPTPWFLRNGWAPPLYYAAWFLLPAFLLVLPRWRTFARGSAWLLIPSLVILVASLGPEQLGPSRWPLRLLPGAWAALIPLAAAVMTSVPRSPGVHFKRWLAVALAIAALITWQQLPDRVPLLLGLWTLLLGMCILVLEPNRWNHESSRNALLLAGTLLIPTWMAAEYPVNTVFDEYFGPARRSDVRTTGVAFPASLVQVYNRNGIDRASGAESAGRRGTSAEWDDVPWSMEESTWVPSGNMGLWRGERLLNGYTPVEMLSLKMMTCGQAIFGWTCDGLVPKVMSKERKTGRTYADLMRVDAIIVSSRMTQSLRDVASLQGWTVQQPSRFVRVARRDSPLPPHPGTVSLVPEGLRVVDAPVVSDDRERIMIERAPGFAGGRIVFARAYYPGHTIQIDGHPAAVERLGGVIIATRVPAGAGPMVIDLRHELPMSALWRILVGLGLLAFGAALWQARPSARGARPAPLND